MGSFGDFLFAYLLGGLTFIPLVFLLIVLHAYLTFPSRTDSTPPLPEEVPDILRRPIDDQFSLKSGTDELEEKFHRTHDSDVATGYFAVCREYVPGGINGKPPERTTPAGEVIAAESPSVYQSMYRSLFDRKQAPAIEPSKNTGKNVKRARNVFYIILRHGHLMLYDDAHQVEVRYVISLAHHDVSIYGGEKEIPEGELWIKRNAICLSRRLDSLADLGGPTPPFYLFSENQSEKEDFYFAMLQNQAKMRDSTTSPPKYQQFNVKHIVTLVHRLHSSEEQLQTRWINAILGRLFLALYRTPEMENLVAKKIAKKISRAKKPNLISRIGLHRIVMGEGAPFITNPRLKDLTVDGNCCVEADVQYAGNFRVEISATVRIDLGQRFKAREVDIVLAVVLKKLEGHGLLRFKPPPSNRFWISFETMPNIALDIEPIVSSKQITYGIILRTIESKIREMVAESIVLPFWDDVPFLDTRNQPFRGGIWEHDLPAFSRSTTEITDEFESLPGSPMMSKEDLSDTLKVRDDRMMSAPVLTETLPKSLRSRRGSKLSQSDFKDACKASSSALDRPTDVNVPRPMRSHSFSHVADPVLTAHTAQVDKVVSDEAKDEDRSNAASAMIEISTRSPGHSPDKTPSSSPPTTSFIDQAHSLPHSREPSIVESVESFRESKAPSQSFHSANVEGDFTSADRIGSGPSTSSLSDKFRRRSPREVFSRPFTQSSSSDEKFQATLSRGPTSTTSKKWGWNMFSRSDQIASQETEVPDGTPEHPIGRGRPLPPPGTPLPPPDKSAYRRKTVPVPKRKPVPPALGPSAAPPPLPERPAVESTRPVPKPPLPTRKPILGINQVMDGTDEVLVVEAPSDSDPNSPAPEVDSDVDAPDSLFEHRAQSEGEGESKSGSLPAAQDDAGDEVHQNRDATPTSVVEQDLIELPADEVVV